MFDKILIDDIQAQSGDKESILSKQIACIVLRERDSMKAAQLVLKEINELAKQRGADGVAKALESPSANILSETNNAIFYNIRSVTQKSPHSLAYIVLSRLSETLAKEVLINE